ncbi:MAG: hypothetical protein AAF570_08145, partial [Bacteroidota bacterium]
MNNAKLNNSGSQNNSKANNASTTIDMPKALISSTMALIFALAAGLFLSSCTAKSTPTENKSYVPEGFEGEDCFIDTPEPPVVKYEAVDSAHVEGGDSTAALGMSVLRAATCTSIEAYEPVGEGSQFTLDVGRVYLYSKIKMPKGETGQIKHVWKLNGKVISTVELAVKGPTFRTR